MKISKEKLQKIINEELQMAQNGSEMPYSGPKMGSKMDQNHHDLEGNMAKNQLFNIAKYSIAMMKVLEDDQELEAWVQSKLTLAQDYLGKVKHYLEYELQVEMQEPSVEEINELVKKEPEVELEKEKNYAGQGRFFYDV
tara:strand:+ start:4305 stop:4721 length:417 start_codon:yes stop_codon:yes gene_type:complete